ncbi:MAG: PEP/pyruvate-binding domain-containing protein, partial [Tumebacillaceae bacterium]
MSKYVYLFDEGHAGMKELLGGKGANLAEMTRAGLPVPEGFTLSTIACNEYYEANKALTAQMQEQIQTALTELERRTGKTFGDSNNPLLVSVRSGAVFSMPGMMDTVLNLGLNDETVSGLAKLTGNERFAYDCYRRFIQMFGDVVLGIEHYYFERILEEVKHARRIEQDPDLTADDWKQVIAGYKALVLKETRHEFPQQPLDQLIKSIQAVFDSWNNQRAVVYRKINKIPGHLGTAVNVQAMVFGNQGDDCATGVAFTRNPSTGQKELYGEFLINAQGEDVVAGIRTPQPIKSLAAVMP